MRPRDDSGMASVAVLLFAAVAMMILLANFQLNCAVNASSDALDGFQSQMVEKNGVAEIVKESILAIGETATVDSSNPLQTEIQTRLASMTLPPGVSLACGAPTAAVPANPFFPAGTPAASAVPQYFSATADTPAIAGMGGLFTSIACQGPVSDLGTLSVDFTRTDANDPGDNRTYTVDATMFSVPLTNVDVVAYGLPASGAVATAAPAVPAGFFGSGVSTLVVTSNNPANDPTAYPDLYSPGGVEQLPYEYRNAASFSWNAYEYVWSAVYQDQLLGAASLGGALYDFAADDNPAIPGVTASGNSLTIDCAAVTSPLIAVVDNQGVGTVTVTGSAAPGSAFVLVVRNVPGSPAHPQTSVTFAGNNVRPAIFYLENCNVGFSGNPQIEGALFLDPNVTIGGAAALFGHLSFYAPANPLGGLALTVNDSPAVKSALAPIAPRVMLVSTSTPFSTSQTP